MSDDRTARAHRAFNELSEINDAFDRVEAALVKAMRDAPVGADPMILRLHMSLQNLAAVKKAVQLVTDDGLMAEDALARAELTGPT